MSGFLPALLPSMSWGKQVLTAALSCQRFGGVFEQVGAVFVDVVGQGRAQREAVGGEVGPVLELDVEIAPDHGPEGVVIPGPMRSRMGPFSRMAEPSLYIWIQ